MRDGRRRVLFVLEKFFVGDHHVFGIDGTTDFGRVNFFYKSPENSTLVHRAKVVYDISLRRRDIAHIAP